MMKGLLERLAAGEDLETLLPEFKDAVRKDPRGRELDADTMLRADAEKDFNLDEGWADVEAAVIMGDITEEQYEAIRAAVTG
jgi:hypothetical protein